MLLKGLYFDWDDDSISQYNYGVLKGTSIGYIAQDVEKIVPEVVHTDITGLKSVQYNILSTIALGSLQEQMTRIFMMKEKINVLKSVVE